MNRETMLKIGAGVCGGLLIANYVVIGPAIDAWNAQSDRMAAIRKKVTHGRQLTERERSTRGRWAEMQRLDLPADNSAAEEAVFKAISRWTQASHVIFTNLAPQWRPHEEGYDTLEFRATVTGDQASLGRLMYELESDPLPGRLEEAEISARDAKGQGLSAALRFTFVRLNEGAGAGGRGAR